MLKNNVNSNSDNSDGDSDGEFIKFNKIQNNHKFPNIINKNKSYYKKIDHKKKINHKKILCENYIVNNYCDHGIKCSYAHSLNEQNIDPCRQNTLNILNSKDDLGYINWDDIIYNNLMQELLSYTKLCDNCINKKCTGGYNCKYGSCLEKYLICYDDLNYGHCDNEICNKIHLSKRNLKPVLKKINNGFTQHIKHNIVDNTDNISNTYILDSLSYIMRYFNNNNINVNDINDINNDNNYISSSDDECYKSIFIDKIDNLILDNDFNLSDSDK